MEFFYSQAPETMRAVSQALFSLTTAFGAWLCIPLLLLVNHLNQWLPDDINGGHLEYYFLSLGTIVMVDLGVFVMMARRYEYKVGVRCEVRVRGKLTIIELLAGGACSLCSRGWRRTFVSSSSSSSD